MTILLSGVGEFGRALDAYIARASAASKKAVTDAAHFIEAEAKAELGTYSHKRGTPTPSPIGHPPAVVSGTLRRSIRVTDVEAISVTGWTASVGPSAIYGRIQELGGFTGAYDSYLPARPYMQPAFELATHSGALLAIYTTAWRAAF